MLAKKLCYISTEKKNYYKIYYKKKTHFVYVRIECYNLIDMVLTHHIEYI